MNTERFTSYISSLGFDPNTTSTDAIVSRIQELRAEGEEEVSSAKSAIWGLATLYLDFAAGREPSIPDSDVWSLVPKGGVLTFTEEGYPDLTLRELISFLDGSDAFDVWIYEKSQPFADYLATLYDDYDEDGVIEDYTPGEDTKTPATVNE